MEKEELLSLIDEKVSKQGNQGATELGRVLGSVVEYLEEKTGPKCLKFTSINGGDIGFIVMNPRGYDIPKEYVKPNIEYSLDGGETWETYELIISDDPADANLVTPDEGEGVLFRGINDSLSYYLSKDDDWLYVRCYMEGSFSAEGDVTSLLNGVGGDTPLTAGKCYMGMFQDCRGLTSAPALPSTILSSDCYVNMFSDCKDLLSAPALPATSLTGGCYSGMFSGCTSLTAAPVLPATTLAPFCYSGMFDRCTGVTSHHVATMNNSEGVFNRNESCVSFTIDAETPPAITANTIAGLKADCIIYVPAGSVDAYKAARYWEARASYIQAKP